MLVSRCHDAEVRVVETSLCSYYVCAKCGHQTDGKFALDLDGVRDAEIQSEIA